LTPSSWQQVPELAPQHRRTPIADLFERTIRLYRQNFVPMLVTFGAFQLPIVVATLPFNLLQARWSQIRWQGGAFLLPAGVDVTVMRNQLIVGSLSVLVLVSITLILGTFGIAAVVVIAARASEGQRPSPRDVFKALGDLAGRLLGYATLLVAGWLVLAFTLGGIGLALGGAAVGAGASVGGLVVWLVIVIPVAFAILVFLGTRLALSIPALVVERSAPLDALRRSWGLVAGSTWRTLGILFLGAMVVGLGASIINPVFVPGLFEGLMTGSLTSYVVIAVVSGVVQALLGPIMPTLITVLYFDYRR